jgi:hypothetical protein
MLEVQAAKKNLQEMQTAKKMLQETASIRTSRRPESVGK